MFSVYDLLNLRWESGNVSESSTNVSEPSIGAGGPPPQPPPTPQGAAPLNVPQFYAASFAAGWAIHDLMITCMQPRPLMGAQGEVVNGLAALVPVMTLQMSAQSAKDFYLIMRAAVEGYEQQWGKIETEFSRQREGNTPA